MIRAHVRRARKGHLCSPCLRTIRPGELYRDAVASPQHEDLGNDGWQRFAECRGCAERCGRADQFPPSS